MGCCGGKREQFHDRILAPQSREIVAEASSLPRVIPQTFVHFEYIGKTGMTVVGPVTGLRYRFDVPGAVVAVEGRDAPSVSAVPNLRRTRSPLSGDDNHV